MADKFDFNRYLKILAALFSLAVLAVVVSFWAMDTAMAAPAEPETIYSDGSFVLTSDGKILEVNKEMENVSQVDLSGSGSSESVFVPSQAVEDVLPEVVPGQMNVLAADDVISLPTDHCVSYEVIFDGTAYTAVFPLSVADSLAVSDGVLCNVGSSAVTGRLFTDSFDTGHYGERFVTLNSVLSTSGNNNAYRYGSWSYVTTYSPNTGSMQTNLSSSTLYGNIYVVEEPEPFSSFNVIVSLLFGMLGFIAASLIVANVRKGARY